MITTYKIDKQKYYEITWSNYIQNQYEYNQHIYVLYTIYNNHYGTVTYRFDIILIF